MTTCATCREPITMRQGGPWLSQGVYVYCTATYPASMHTPVEASPRCARCRTHIVREEESGYWVSAEQRTYCTALYPGITHTPEED